MRTGRGERRAGRKEREREDIGKGEREISFE